MAIEMHSPAAAEFFELLGRSELVAQQASYRKELRVTPQSDRSRATFEQILEGAARLLAEEVPFRELNTARIAEESEVNVATLYRYFPDLDAILVELAMRREVEQCEAMAAALPEFETTPDWRLFISGLVAGIGEMRHNEPYGIALVRGMMSNPALRPVVEYGREAGSQLCALAFTKRDPSRSYEEWLPIVRVPVAVARDRLDDAYSTDPPDLRQVELVQLMIVSYLEHFLGDPSA